MRKTIRAVAAVLAGVTLTGTACAAPQTQRAVQTAKPVTPAPAPATKPTPAPAPATKPTPAPKPTVYPKAITSDSILWDNRGSYYGRGWWVDVESGRQAYTRGSRGLRSHWEAVQGIIPQTGRTLIVVDNAAGVTDEQWRRFVADTVRLLPDDKCLVFVAPYFRADVNAERHRVVAARAEVLRREITAQPCHTVIPWDKTASADPSLVQPAPDGQHPTAAGAAWLQQQIFAL